MQVLGTRLLQDAAAISNQQVAAAIRALAAELIHRKLESQDAVLNIYPDSQVVSQREFDIPLGDDCYATIRLDYERQVVLITYVGAMRSVRRRQQSQMPRKSA